MNPFKIAKDWLLAYAVHILFTAVVVLFVAYTYRGFQLDWKDSDIEELQVEIEFQKTENELKSFRELVRHKKGDTQNEINATISNTNVVPDGTYQLWK